MAIRQSDLLAAARTSTVRVTKAMVEEAQLRGRKTVFRCRSQQGCRTGEGLRGDAAQGRLGCLCRLDGL
ncbi:protein of unknown function [uncultured Sphingopyxis sp.]|uniref:Uncharacterized protein n=1 Tax=uncultured Sphingopyxis sp. TaxID=310581 RepID=A0A1Y5PRR8_9SPHN|nr:protein of unknown function [uncultured Sphingopyxis sp.]